MYAEKPVDFRRLIINYSKARIVWFLKRVLLRLQRLFENHTTVRSTAGEKT
jgi:hypothetical protein